MLWIDSAIEAVHALTLDAGQTAPVAFTVSRPDGNYSVRLDRQLGKFTVGAGDGGDYRVGLLIALGVAGLLVVAGGAYRLAHSRA